MACERKLQDFGLSQKNGVIPQIHFVSHGFSPTKPKTCAVWVRKDLLRWELFICPWYNYFNYLWIYFYFCFRLFCLKKKNWKFSKRQKYFILCLVLFFLSITWIMISLSWFRTYVIRWRNIESMYCKIECISYFWFCMSMY